VIAISEYQFFYTDGIYAVKIAFAKHLPELSKKLNKVRPKFEYCKNNLSKELPKLFSSQTFFKWHTFKKKSYIEEVNIPQWELVGKDSKFHGIIFMPILPLPQVKTKPKKAQFTSKEKIILQNPKRFIISGIIKGPKGYLAIVNGKYLREGDWIEDCYIEKISLFNVIIKCGKEKLFLTPKTGEK